MSETKPAHIDEVLTVMFTPEIGARMRHVRIKLLLDQKEMAIKFGTSQQNYSRLERGHIRFFEITLKRFKEIFEDATLFILRGTGSGKWELTREDRKKWLEKKYAKQLKPKSLGTYARGIQNV